MIGLFHSGDILVAKLLSFTALLLSFRWVQYNLAGGNGNLLRRGAGEGDGSCGQDSGWLIYILGQGFAKYPSCNLIGFIYLVILYPRLRLETLSYDKVPFCK